MLGTFRWAVVALLLTAAAQAAPYTIKVEKAAPPKDLSPDVAAALSDESVQLLNAKGEVLAQVWFCKTVHAKSAQFTGTPTYQDLQETSLLGAVRYPAEIRDYRKQKIKAGLYTLRLGLQPMDGDHMGTAPDPYFALLVGAAKDKQTAPLKDGKQLFELSSKSIGKTHAGVFLLFPLDKAPAEPKLVNKGSGTWAVEWKETATAGGQTAALPIALTLVGHTSAE